MNCKRCGKNNPDNAACCLYCGVALEEDSSEKQTSSQNNSSSVLVAIIIVLSVIFLVVVGMLIHDHMTPRRSFGGGGGGGGFGPPPISDQGPEETEQPEDKPDETSPAPEETEKPESEKRAEKKTGFLQQAALIEQYTEDHLNTADTQTDINTESGVVYKMWDGLLNDVYRYLKAILPASEFATLQQDEMDWIAEKEAAIEAAGAEWEGGTGEAMARNMVGIDYTMMRCYYLISLIK